jgi:hypothetical protein
MSFVQELVHVEISLISITEQKYETSFCRKENKITKQSLEYRLSTLS